MLRVRATDRTDQLEALVNSDIKGLTRLRNGDTEAFYLKSPPNPAVYFFRVEKNDILVGWFMVIARTYNTCEVHLYFHSDVWGEDVPMRAFRLMERKLELNSPWTRIMGLVSENNRPAQFFVSRVGARRTGYFADYYAPGNGAIVYEYDIQ